MKIMIIHPGTQHSAKLAVAIKKAGNEVKLVTTVYNKRGSLVNRLKNFMSSNENNKLSARTNHDLVEEDIELIDEFQGLVLLFIARIDKHKKIYVRYKHHVAKNLGKKAAKIAIKENYDIVIAFDSYAFYPFKILMKEKPEIKRIIDFSAAYAPAAKSIYQKEIDQYPELEQTLRADRCVLWYNRYYQELVQEAKLADSIMCASNYTKQTLIKNGIDESIVSVIPYGYNAVALCDDKKIETHKEFNVLFVGGVNVMKGIPYAIKALRQLEYNDINLILVGNTQDTIKNMAEGDSRIKVKGFITHEKLTDVYEDADLFLFPSLSDGFGFAPLEAMSFGVPCIVTENSGISDIIENGVNGFIIHSSNSDEIKEIIKWCYNNKDKLLAIGKAAKAKSLSYSEKNYENSLKQFIDKYNFTRG